ncbi:trace amine-associated receptor 13c-like [Channa argus]|uniref:trace amine-associated receptor 13c-like n=1 Tax=Channa argus TaxID=215402 RepID=UPI0035211A6A
MESWEEAELCFPQLPNTSCKQDTRPYSASVTLVIYILLSFISLLTVVLNLLVIISISHFRQLHSPTNLLLLSLAVSDFLVGLLVMPFQILLKEPCWLLGDLVCVLFYVIPFITVSASTVSMVLISVDRYVAICDPLHYSTRITQKRVQFCVLLCWTYSIFYSLMLLDNLKQPGSYNSCYGECVINIIGAVDIVLGFIIPVSTIIILYVRVFVVAVSQARALRSHITAVKLQSSVTVTVKKSELKAARTLGVVVAVFLLCYCPPYCVSLSGSDLTIGTSTKDFIIFLLLSNSCLNPVIYAFFYPWFRRSVKLIVTLEILQPNSRETSVYTPSRPLRSDNESVADLTNLAFKHKERKKLFQRMTKMKMHILREADQSLKGNTEIKEGREVGGGKTLEETELCFPQLLNTSCKKPMRLNFDKGQGFNYFLLSFISLLTVVLNLLVIISISHFRQLHSPTNLLLLSLAVSDFLMGLFVMPFQILLNKPCWFLGDLLCVVVYIQYGPLDKALMLPAYHTSLDVIQDIKVHFRCWETGTT